MNSETKGAVLIVGARSDMARAIAKSFAERGHPIMLAARGKDSLTQDAADMAIRYQVEVSTHDLDVTDLAAQTGFLDALGSLPSCMVCAVGTLGDQDADATDPQAIRAIIEANMIGPVTLIEAMAARMVAAGDARAIIGIGSVAGDRGRAKNYIYGSAKAGFATYLSGLRQKYVATPLHIMTVKPGFVRTAMTEGMDLPGPLTSSADDFAAGVMRAYDRGASVHYDIRWRILMAVIRALPERIFLKTKF
jgi:short-subunit dehydrogenase